MVRAKFKVDRLESTLQSRPRTVDGKQDWSNPIMAEMRTVVMSPVYGNGDPAHENTKFWQASPSGQLTLGIINQEAWANFELGKEYYVDFTSAK